ncbi:MAG: hypothetical protein IPJ07_06970 [Acidobacteria bacterium]|nr:hypothetical protein [Acidobacteriota bacterium]
MAEVISEMATMRNTIKYLLWLSLLLLAASFVVSHFGEQYALKQIPPEVRAGMSDTDWVGAEWIMRGLVLLLLAVISGLAALILFVLQRYKQIKSKTATH